MEGSNICSERKNNKHCWHTVGGQLTSNPPLQNYVCCYCGKTKTERLYSLEQEAGHGPHNPKTEFKNIRE